MSTVSFTEEMLGHITFGETDFARGAQPSRDGSADFKFHLPIEVEDIDATVDALVAKGVTMRRYDGMNQDERGISRGKAAGQGPDIVWFTDPAGNILSALSS